MGFSGWRKLSLASVTCALVAAIAAPGAWAATEDIIAPSPVPPGGEPTAGNGWQAGTCKSDGPPVCSVDTPDQFFEEAAAHPQVGFTQFIVKNEPGTLGPEQPVDALKNIRVDLPVGLSVNPQASAVQCAQSQFDLDTCPGDSEVGVASVTASLLGLPVAPIEGVTQVPVYNISPPFGRPARFGLKLAGSPVYLEADVAWESDYHEGFTIAVPELPIVGETILKNRLVFNGRAGDGTFITTPSTCHDPETEPAWATAYSTYLLASSVTEEANPEYEFPADAAPAIESPLPEGKHPIDCEGVPYEPGIGVDPATEEVDSPSGAATEVTIPHNVPADPEEEGARDSANTAEAQVHLPAGLGLNPAAANGLVSCSDEQFGKGTREPVECPAESKVGTVAIETPPLDEALEGDVFVGTQLSRDPASGDEFRIFVDAESERYGVSVRLIGRVAAGPTTGQLTARFGELPQVPFSSFVIDLDDGPGAALTSPATCGPHETKGVMTPWTENPDAEPSGEFSLGSAPGGSACPKTLGERPFAPSFAAAATGAQAASYTGLQIDIGRADGEQELKGAEVTLPPGVTAKLAGVRYCPEETIAAAGANSGVAEESSPSCPADSLVGNASIVAGSGPEPLRIDGGKAFLAGPYNGAPLSLAVITPATAGPFDLGTVVVRVALFLDSKTAQVKAVTDPIPHVYGGVKLDIRGVSVKVDRPEFTLNPTNCSASAFAGILRGGGADPDDPAAFSSVAASSPYQASGCEALPFGPKLYVRAFGGKKRRAHPKVRAILVARAGDASISRASVTLPKGLLLDQAAIAKICTRVQFAARQCPGDSVYGFAEAKSPLLDGPLKGNVYLRSSDNTLPDLVADLHGQVDIELSGRTDTTKNGRIRNTFDVVPDVPVSEFTLTLRGGKKGLLQNSRNLCKRKMFTRIVLNAQNGKSIVKKKQRFKPGCKKKKHRKRGKHDRARG
jgi:hypothetical protein